MNKLSEDSKKSMLSRVLTACVMAAVGIPVIIFGNWFFFIFIFILTLIAIHEVLQAPGKRRYNILIMGVVYIFTLSFIYWMFFKDREVFNQIVEHGIFTLNSITVSTIGITVFFLMLFLISIAVEKFTINDVCYLFSLALFVGLSVLGVYFLRFFPASLPDHAYSSVNDFRSCLLFVYVLIGDFMSDIGAYFVGVLFGKHRMNPRISPKKSWEGFFGGVLISFGVSFGFAAVCDALNAPILPGILDFQGTNWLWLLLLSFLMPITANIGDFLFSAIKRNFAIKDFGTILPGHGGILDRCDSLLVTSLVTAILVVMIANRWNFMI